MTDLNEWLESASGALNISAPTAAEQQVLLDVAREVAHNVLRPGAPLTTFLLGVAIGRGADLGPAAATVVDLARRSATDG
jgi:hypothetical protein